VKVDGRFIQNLTPDSRDAMILKHVTALCREMGVVVVAEMVETREAADVCRDLGVKLGQGWVFSKPLAAPVWTPPKRAQKPSLLRARRGGKSEEWC
jgi:EAL domain-containing protein (putative c-di-GMP-specific phosphodiesterase class I)